MLLTVCFANAPKPHIVVITADDFGYANVGYHRTDDPTDEVQTPRIDALARSGVIIDRHYTYSIVHHRVLRFILGETLFT